MQHQMANMFAVPLYRAALGRSFSASEGDCFTRMLQDPILAISNYSSRSKSVLREPALAEIRQLIEQHLAHYFRIVFNTTNEVTLQVTQSWLTRTVKGQSHHTHTHPNSVVSGVLYISLATQDGISFFRNEDAQWYELLRSEDTYYNASRYFIQTAPGDLILFPSHIRHGVHQVSEDIERISLSFNTFFSGELGREEFSNHLRVLLG